MSVYFRVYVGPLLKCSPKGACDAYAVTRGRLTCGDDTDWSKLDYDIVHPDELDFQDRQGRQLWFSQHDNMTPIDVLSQAVEIADMNDQYQAEIRALREHYTSVRVGWGVVPSFV
jgi:hypothetical protein